MQVSGILCTHVGPDAGRQGANHCGVELRGARREGSRRDTACHSKAYEGLHRPGWQERRLLAAIRCLRLSAGQASVQKRQSFRKGLKLARKTQGRNQGPARLQGRNPRSSDATTGASKWLHAELSLTPTPLAFRLLALGDRVAAREACSSSGSCFHQVCGAAVGSLRILALETTSQKLNGSGGRYFLLNLIFPLLCGVHFDISDIFTVAQKPPSNLRAVRGTSVACRR